MKAMSSTTAMKAVKVWPARQHSISSAKRVYKVAAPEMPSTARRLVAMGRLWLCSVARK